MRRKAVDLDWMETHNIMVVRHPGLRKYHKYYKINLKWLPRLVILPPIDNSIKNIDLRKW